MRTACSASSFTIWWHVTPSIALQTLRITDKLLVITQALIRKKKTRKPFKGDEISAMKSNHRLFCFWRRLQNIQSPSHQSWQGSRQQLLYVISNRRESCRETRPRGTAATRRPGATHLQRALGRVKAHARLPNNSRQDIKSTKSLPRIFSWS